MWQSDAHESLGEVGSLCDRGDGTAWPCDHLPIPRLHGARRLVSALQLSNRAVTCSRRAFTPLDSSGWATEPLVGTIDGSIAIRRYRDRPNAEFSRVHPNTRSPPTWQRPSWSGSIRTSAPEMHLFGDLSRCVRRSRRRIVGREGRGRALRCDDRLRRWRRARSRTRQRPRRRPDPESRVDLAVEAAEECPGECIMIEPYDQAAIDGRGA